MIGSGTVLISGSPMRLIALIAAWAIIRRSNLLETRALLLTHTGTLSRSHRRHQLRRLFLPANLRESIYSISLLHLWTIQQPIWTDAARRQFSFCPRPGDEKSAQTLVFDSADSFPGALCGRCRSVSVCPQGVHGTKLSRNGDIKPWLSQHWRQRQRQTLNNHGWRSSNHRDRPECRRSGDRGCC